MRNSEEGQQGSFDDEGDLRDPDPQVEDARFTMVSMQDLTDIETNKVRADYFTGATCWKCELGIAIHEDHGMCFVCYKEIMAL